ncbi:hypothetical protein [Myceligenerans crystallogenes]|uniref:Uncharacterized protein n=1 Tax=Myceligenerans crystallogenes TaxID=316335 RepID=A0ABP4ZNE3_9MICO
MTDNWGPWGDLARRLVDTRRCPACGADLARPACDRCGLDLRAERAHEVHRLSLDAASLLRERGEVIARMREDQARKVHPAPAVPPAGSGRDDVISRVPTAGGRVPTAGAPGTGAPDRPEARTGQAEPAPASGAAAAHQPSSSLIDEAPAAPAEQAPVPAGLKAAAAIAAQLGSQEPAAPGSGPASSAPGPGPAPAAPAPGPRTDPPMPPASRAKPAAPRRDIAMQPILAGAGALLLAVAAVVFVFFTFGDNLALRAVVTGLVTVAAATVAALLRRAGLRTTSEAVAGLAAVLCWVDVELAMQAGLLDGLEPAMARAVVLAGLAPLFVVVGHRLEVRSWVSAGLAAALVVPFSAVIGTPASAWTSWWWAFACSAVAGLAWVELRLLPATSRRLGARFRPERRVLRVVRAAGLPLALVIALLPTELPGLNRWGATAVLWSAIVLAAGAGGYLLRVRSWASTAVVAAPVAPVLVVAGIPGAVWSSSRLFLEASALTSWAAWWWTLAFVLVAAVAHVGLRALPRLARRLGDQLGGPFTTEGQLLRVARAAAVPVALLVTLFAADLPGVSRWGATAILWSGVVAVGVAGGLLLRVRSWITTGLLAVPVVPALVAAELSASTASAAASWATWCWTLAFAVTAFAAHAARAALPGVARRLGDQFGPAPDVESRLLRVARGASFPLALGASWSAVSWWGADPLDGWTTTASWCVVTVAALGAGLGLRVRSWVSAGVLAAPVIPVLVVARLDVPGPSVWSAWWWVAALVLVAFAALAGMRGLRPAARRLGDRLGLPFAPEAAVLRVVRGAALPAALGVSLLAAESVAHLGQVAIVFSREGAITLLWAAVVVVGLLAGTALRVRSWITAGLVVLPVLPVLVVVTATTRNLAAGWFPWAWTLAFVLVAVLGWAARAALAPLARRLGQDRHGFFLELAFLQSVRGAGLPLALLAAVITSTVYDYSAAQPQDLPDAEVRLTLLWAAVLTFGAIAGHLLRVRSWMSAAVSAAPVLPFLVLAALPDGPGSWWPAVACLAAALLTLLPRAAVAVSGTRLGSRLAPEHAVADVVAVLTLLAAGALSIDVAQPRWLPGMGGTAVLIALIAAVTAVLRRLTHHRHWSVAGGALAVAAGVASGLTSGDDAVGWAPLGAACAWILLAVATAPRLLRGAGLGSVRGALAVRTRDDLLISGWIVAVLAALPAAGLGITRVTELVRAAALAPRADWFLPGDVVGPVVLGAAPTGWATLGVAALAAVTLLAARLAPGEGIRRAERFAAPFLALGAVAGAAMHPALPPVITLIALAVTGVLLVAATADRATAWPRLRPVVDAVQEAGRALAGAANGLRVIGGRPVSGAERRLARHAAIIGAIVVIALLATSSWISRTTAAGGALVVCGLVLALRGTARRPLHPLLVGVGYVYPLLALGAVLGWLDLSLVAAICTVSAVASLVTIVVTLSTRTSRGEWYVVLGITAAPFVAGVGTVVFERSWWSVGAAGAMLCLELVLLLTARLGLPVAVRAAAAFLLLPTSGVMVTSAGGEIAELYDLSGSPFVLPVAATFVSAVAAAAARIAERIATRVPDGGPGLPGSIRAQLERSALLTGAITVYLAYTREAAGPDIAVAVLLVLAVGAALVAREPGRRRLWILVWALGLAALWTALGSRGVGLVEAYTFPPAVVAGVVGLVMAWRLRRSVPGGAGRERAVRNMLALAVAGGALVFVPSFVVYLTRTEPGDWRAWALVGFAAAALVAGFLGVRGGLPRLVGGSLAGFAAFASVAGVIESWRVAPAPWAWPNDRGFRSAELLETASYRTDELRDAAAATAEGVAQPYVPVGIPGATEVSFVVGLGWAAAVVVVLTLCVRLLRPIAGPRLTELLRGYGFVPALVVGTLAALWHMEPAWGAVITLFVLELALLALLVLGVRRLVAGRATGAAPWVVWVCATLIAIAAWSPRELRVEAFSAPLGIALIAAGWIAMRGAQGGTASSDERPRLGRWPVGFAGSWPTLALGVLALVGPSVLSTATDPLTIRASAVVFVALMAVLAGSRLRLSAPFWLGVVTLGVEVVVVFAKLGVGVSPLPWILTLVPAALVLLIIATLDERRTAASGGTAAYLRDLR